MSPSPRNQTTRHNPHRVESLIPAHISDAAPLSVHFVLQFHPSSTRSRRRSSLLFPVQLRSTIRRESCLGHYLLLAAALPIPCIDRISIGWIHASIRIISNSLIGTPQPTNPRPPPRRFPPSNNNNNNTLPSGVKAKA